MLKASKASNSDNVKVVVRVRPPLARELEGDIFLSTVQVLEDDKSVQLFEYYNLEGLNQDQLEEYIDDTRNFTRHEYTFDHVYNEDATQEEVYVNTARLSVCSALEGYNATIFAYGQTGTGKTYTMEGFKYSLTDENRGIIPRAIEDIFSYIEAGSKDEEVTFMVRASYIQIYNENVSDLLRNEKKNLQIREDPKKGVYV
jgi:kinesin family protein 3/17